MTTRAQFASLRFLRDSFKCFLPNSQAVALAVILIVSFVLIYSLSGLLMPVFVSIVLAYLLEGMVGKAES
ncbi:MAG: AI-2E family transporter, partial [Methylobacter sp.]